jgi:hypothetical protein
MASELLLWLFVVNLGTVFGAGLYESRISMARWLGPPNAAAASAGWHADEARRDDTGRRFWGFTTTVPLTLLTVANLWAGWHSADPVRAWWLTSGLVALGERAFTFSYFIPRMVALLRAPDTGEARKSALRWARLNHLRQALVLSAWLLALQAFFLAGSRAT